MAGFKIFLFNSIHLTQVIRCTPVVTMLPKLRGMFQLRTGIIIQAFGIAEWLCFFHVLYTLLYVWPQLLKQKTVICFLYMQIKLKTALRETKQKRSPQKEPPRGRWAWPNGPKFLLRRSTRWLVHDISLPSQLLSSWLSQAFMVFAVNYSYFSFDNRMYE